MRGWGVGGRGETREEVLKRRKSEEVQKGSHRYLCAPLFILSGDKVALPTGVTGNWEVCWINHDEKSSPLLQRRLLRLQKRQLCCCRTSIPALKVMSGVSVWVSPPWPSTGIAPFYRLPQPSSVSFCRPSHLCASSLCVFLLLVEQLCRLSLPLVSFLYFFFLFLKEPPSGRSSPSPGFVTTFCVLSCQREKKIPSPSRLFLFAVPVRRFCSQSSRWSEWERKKNPRMEGLYLVGGVRKLTGDGWCVSADFTGWRLVLLWNCRLQRHWHTPSRHGGPPSSFWRISIPFWIWAACRSALASVAGQKFGLTPAAQRLFRPVSSHTSSLSSSLPPSTFFLWS